MRPISIRSTFGAGAQGIERAARMYFDKSAQDLTLAEAALLAGLPKSPTQYNPFRHYDNALCPTAGGIKPYGGGWVYFSG